MLFTFNNSNKLNSEMRSTVVNAFNKNKNAKNSNLHIKIRCIWMENLNL